MYFHDIYSLNKMLTVMNQKFLYGELNISKICSLNRTILVYVILFFVLPKNM